MQNQEYTAEERLYFTEFLFKDVISYMVQLLQAMEQLEIPFADLEVATQAMVIKDAKYITNSFIFPVEVGQAVKLLWNDAGVKACYARRSEFNLADTAA